MSRSVIEQIRDELVTGAERYELRRRRIRAAAVSVVLAVVVGAGALVWNADTAGRSKVLVQPGTTSTTGKGPLPTLTPGPLPGLAQLPPPPGTEALPTAPVWTGHEFLFVGITVDDGPIMALSYNVDTREWREIAHPPSTIGRLATAVWTGQELIVCCGGAPEGSGAAAYDPATDTWRLLPDPPVHNYTTAAWTGTDVIVVASDGIASFDPARNAWTSLPTPSELATFNKSLWTGHDLVVWPSPGARAVHTGEVYNPETREWSALPAPPERSWPAMPDIAWLDGSLVVIGGLPGATAGSERLVGARYDRSTNTWAPLPEPLPEPHPAEGNLGSQLTLWTGKELLMFAGGLASGWSATGVLSAYDPTRDSWRLVGDTKETALRPVVMAGDRVLLERDGNYYLSQPGWVPTAPASPIAEAACPGAQHPWQISSAPDGTTGDGLPQSWFATRARAESELRDRRTAIMSDYRAVSASIRVENGRATKRVNGAIEIVTEPIATIVVTLPDPSRCPDAPAFDNGIPLTFVF